jgi:hypothetical protein
MKQKLSIAFFLVIALISFSSCLTAKKIDTFVGKQFNNELPKPDKKKNQDIRIISNIPYRLDNISTTETKTSNILPLIIYWQWDYKNTCTLNPAIAVNIFTKTVNLQANKGLNQKLDGLQLELTLEQLANAFAFDDKAHLVWLIHAFGWDKISVQPDFKDLVVTYKVLQNGSAIKSGSITIKNNERNKNLRFFQSWKSAISEYLIQYNEDITSMTKLFVNKLAQEL